MTLAVIATEARDHDVLSGDITFPRRGVWCARLDVDADEDDPLVVGPCKIVLAEDNEGEEVEISGTIVEIDASTFEGRATAVIFGGTGALSKTVLPARTYQQTPDEVPIIALIADAIQEGGESYDDDPSEDLLGIFVSRWHRAGGSTAADLLDRLAELFGLTWYISDDGLVAIELDVWPEADLEAAGFFLEGPEDAIDRTIEGTVARASLRPGCIVRGRKIEEVVYTIDESGLRCVLRWGEGIGRGGIRGELDRAVKMSLPNRAYHETYEVTVRRQLADGTLDVEADNELVGGVTSVPYYPGLIGCRMVIAEGTRATLAFLAGDETKPCILSFERHVYTPLVDVNNPDVAVARVNDAVNVGTLTLTAASDGAGGISTIAVTYTPPAGEEQIVSIAPGIPVSVALTGIITTGSPEVFLRANP